MRLLLIGHGRMGKLVEGLAPEYGATIARVIASSGADDLLSGFEPAPDIVAIDFSTGAAVPHNLPRLAAHGVNVVLGTTGWAEHEDQLKKVVSESGIGVVAAPNFSLGLNIFQIVVEEAARQFGRQASFEAWIHEWHHSAKKDAPSGTALQLEAAMKRAGYTRRIDVSSSRAGSIPGIHEVGFDGPSDTITLTHTVRDRAVFARGALEAAKWLVGKRGWFTMREVLTAPDPRP